MVIVDTSVWVDFFRGHANPESEWLFAALGREPVGLTDLVLSEVLQGLRSDMDFQRVRRELEQLPVYPCVGRELAVRAAENYRLLRASGVTVRKTIDCLIATFCMEENHTLLHRDRDFDSFVRLGLQVIMPAAFGQTSTAS